MAQIAWIAVLVSLPLASECYGRAAHGLLAADFRAFYCAATMARDGQDPYASPALRACENTSVGDAFFPAAPSYVLPAPLPGYALALVVPFTFLPYVVAVVAWIAGLSIAVAISAGFLIRLTRGSYLIIAAALALPVIALTIPAGELVPLSLCGLCGAAYSLRNQRHAGAAAWFALACVQPHVALPAGVALAIGSPRTRVPLALTFATLAAASLATLGIARNLEYVLSVLPAHARSEVGADFQYSFSTIAHAIGMPDLWALRAGAASYVVLSAIGIGIAIQLARKSRDPAFLATIPAAFAVMGGSFIHLMQIALALPAVLLLLALRPQSKRAAWAFMLLSIPWAMAQTATLWLAPLFPAFTSVWQLTHRIRIAFVSACAAAAAIALLSYGAFHQKTIALGSVKAVPIIAGVEAQWRENVRAEASSSAPITWLLRLPTWLGLIALAGASIETLRAEP